MNKQLQNTTELPGGAPLLFRTPFWVSLPSDSSVKLLLKPLTYKMLSSINEAMYITDKVKDLQTLNSIRTLITEVVENFRGAVGFPDVASLINQLPTEDIEYLYNSLIKISVLSDTQRLYIADMLSVQMHPYFSEDSWTCDVCRKKQLDYARGCGFLPKDKRDPAPMLPRINGRRFAVCPISTLDPFILTQAAMAHSFLEAGALPEDGGIGEQTDWFVKIAVLYKSKVAEAKNLAMEQIANENK